MKSLSLLYIALTIFGCKAKRGLQGKGATESSWKTELYFGGSLNGRQWDDFLDYQVSPRFPSYTIINGMGVWKEQRIPAKVMIIFHSGSKADETSIELIRNEFKVEFKRDSVLRANTPTKFEI